MYSGTRVSGGPFPSHASWAMGPDLWLTPSTLLLFMGLTRVKLGNRQMASRFTKPHSPTRHHPVQYKAWVLDLTSPFGMQYPAPALAPEYHRALAD